MEQTPILSIPARRRGDATPTGDPAALARLRRWGGMTLVHDLVHLFDVLGPERMASIRTAALLADAQGVERAAHTLGSSCGQLGALGMQRLSIRIERLARVERLASVPRLLARLEEEHGRFLAWLEAQAVRQERVA